MEIERKDQIEEVKKQLIEEAEKIHFSSLMDIAAIGAIQKTLWVMHRALLLTQAEHLDIGRAMQTAWNIKHGIKDEAEEAEADG